MVSSNVNNFPKFWPWHVWDSKMFICLCTWGLLAPHNGISLTGEEAFLKVKSLYEIGDSFSPSHSKERRLGKLIWPILCVLLPFKNHYMLFPLGKSYSRSSHNWININGIKYWNSILNSLGVPPPQWKNDLPTISKIICRAELREKSISYADIRLVY